MGRLDTRYAPVRRSPSNQASLIHAAPRLACVKPVASVHPEPGSNSSLYYLFFFSSTEKRKAHTCKLTVRLYWTRYFAFRIDGSILISCTTSLSMEICQKSLAFEGFSSFAGAKVRHISEPAKHFKNFFAKYCHFLFESQKAPDRYII